MLKVKDKKVTVQYEECHTSKFHYERRVLKIISVGIPTYAGMKTGFYADFSPRNRFPPLG